MKQRLSALVLLVALACAVVLAPLSAAAAPRTEPQAAPTVTNPLAGIPISGSIPSIGGTFTGLLNITSFAVQNGQLVANGTLSGTLTDATGAVLGTVTNVPVTLPVANISGSCRILHLELGPLDLDLLGLQVHLDRVVLDITAQSGPGNLLGNLLCAVAHLLDQNPTGSGLQQIVNLLNQIIALL